jgi:hypothetical protein
MLIESGTKNYAFQKKIYRLLVLNKHSNMKVASFLFGVLLIFSTCGRKMAASKGKDRWIQLFNGKDMNDWVIKIKGKPLNDNYQNTFRVEDGMMKVRYDGYTDFNRQYGHIYYKRPFSAYLLKVEYRFTGEQAKGGEGWALRNSGAMLHCQPPETIGLNQDFPISCEMQFLGGNGKDPRTTCNLCSPGTNVYLNNKLFTPHCVNSTSKTYHGDVWVSVGALVLGDSLIQHIVEGDTVLTYSKPQIDGRDGSVNKAIYKDAQPITSGYISLQSESHPVDFRKAELYDLSGYMNNRAALAKKIQELRQH